MRIITIGVIVLCIVFVYSAFRHVSIHEKKDLKQFNKLTKKNKKK